MPSDRNLLHLYPDFKAKVDQILAEMQTYANRNMPGYTWKVIEGFRTAAYQKELYAKGRTKPPLGLKHIVTNCDGVRIRSNHQSSLAVDIVPAKGSTIDWHADLKHWQFLGNRAKALGLGWGGDFKRLKDLPHIEWPMTDKATYTKARQWQKDNGLA